MKGVELYGQVWREVYVEGMSRREAARRFGIDPRTVAKMLAFSVPPGYQRSRPAARPKLDPFIGIIDRILEEDKGRPAKQQHTSKRIFERLRDEHVREVRVRLNQRQLRTGAALVAAIFGLFVTIAKADERPLMRAVILPDLIPSVAQQFVPMAVDLPANFANLRRIKIVALRYCGGDNHGGANALGVVYPDRSAPSAAAMAGLNCSEPLSHIAGRLAHSSGAPDWVEVINTHITWTPNSFSGRCWWISMCNISNIRAPFPAESPLATPAVRIPLLRHPVLAFRDSPRSSLKIPAFRANLYILRLSLLKT
jgi:hypothetical protein